MNRTSFALSLSCAGLLALGLGSAIKLVPIPALPPGQSAPLPNPITPLPTTRPPTTPPPGSLPEILPELAPVPTSAPLLPVRPAPVTPAPVTPGPAKPAAGAAYTPSDPLFARQWNLGVVGVPGAWQLSRGGAVTVAVLDTGYVNSPELAGRVVNGYDFVTSAERAGDGNGRDPDASALGELAFHSEVIANLIAAAHDARGMAGINPQARIVQVRVAGTDGMIDVQDLADALRWSAGLSVAGVPANPHPAKLLNLSLYADFIPLTGCDSRVQAAIDAVTRAGALVIAGAANDGADASGYSPAGCRQVLTVTSVTQGGQRPGYANWGRSVALAAPGGERGHGIVATSLSAASGERSPDGTSFAAPHVTGVASLLLAVRPKLTPTTLRFYLTRSATPFPGGACDPNPNHTCGSGLLNAEAALKLALASSVGK